MTDPEKRKKRIEKLQIMVADSEIAAIDDWRFENRAASRSSAIRTLIALGLEYWANLSDEDKEIYTKRSID